MKDAQLDNLTIPERIRSFVYIVGMLGFPIVVASYVLVVLSNDLKVIDKRLFDLEARIDERPMGLDKSTDFIIYLTDALQSDLQDDLPELVKNIDFSVPDEPHRRMPFRADQWPRSTRGLA